MSTYITGKQRFLRKLSWGLAGGVIAVLIAFVGIASAAVPQNTSPPSISGTPQEGKILVANRGDWTNSPTDFDYQWLRCGKSGGSCSSIIGAQSKEYVPVSADVGNTLRVRVTAKNADGSAPATSPATAEIKPAPSNAPQLTASPTISGTPQQGQTLTAFNGSWSGAQPITFSYAWLRCDANGDGCAVLAGATAKTYVPQAADVGNTLRVRVTAKNASGSSSATSVPTAAIRKASAPKDAAISVNEVTPPNRLLIDRFEYSPNPIRSLATTVTLRFRVSDTEDHRVQSALVFVLGIPYGRFSVPAETATGGDGWVTFQLQPTQRLASQLHRGGRFNFFVRVRKPGEGVLAGVSNRRLVQVNLSSP